MGHHNLRNHRGLHPATAASSSSSCTRRACIRQACSRRACHVVRHRVGRRRAITGRRRRECPRRCPLGRAVSSVTWRRASGNRKRGHVAAVIGGTGWPSTRAVGADSTPNPRGGGGGRGLTSGRGGGTHDLAASADGAKEKAAYDNPQALVATSTPALGERGTPRRAGERRAAR